MKQLRFSVLIALTLVLGGCANVHVNYRAVMHDVLDSSMCGVAIGLKTNIAQQCASFAQEVVEELNGN